MVDPEFFIDEKLAETSANARLLFIALWTIADDNYGTLPNRPKWIKTQSFPYEDVDVESLIKELWTKGLIDIFIEDGQEFLFIKHFFKYQRIEKPSKPKYPQYNNQKSKTPRLLPDSSPTTPAEEKRIEEKGKEEKISIEKQKIAAPIEKKEEEKSNFTDVRDQIAKGLTFKATRGVTKPWQEEAFRYAAELGMELDDAQKGRWIKLFKDTHTLRPHLRKNLQTAYSFLSDLSTFRALDTENKMRYFFNIYYKGPPQNAPITNSFAQT